MKEQRHASNQARFWVSLLIGLAFVGFGIYEFHREGNSAGAWAAFFFAVLAFIAAGAYYSRIRNSGQNT